MTGKFGHPYGYGFLHEDINNSGDGGIYAELIQNRAFQYSPEFPVSTAHYFPVNGANFSIEFLDTPLSEALPASLRVSAGSNSTGKIGFKNEGYWGIAVSQQKYTGSFWVKGAYNGSFTASLQSNLTDEVFGSVEVASKSVEDEWTEHEFEIVPESDAPSSNNTFSVTFDVDSVKSGALDFNLISLFPPTYKDRKNGLRVDIAQALADLNPVGRHLLPFCCPWLTIVDLPALPGWQHARRPHERDLLGLERFSWSVEGPSWLPGRVGIPTNTRSRSYGIPRMGRGHGPSNR